MYQYLSICAQSKSKDKSKSKSVSKSKDKSESKSKSKDKSKSKRSCPKPVRSNHEFTLGDNDFLPLLPSKFCFCFQ